MADYKWPAEGSGGGGGGVTSVNTFTGAVEILPGTNITIDNSVPGEITINSSGGAAFIDSVVDTNSIDLTVSSGDLSADLKLSSASAGGTALKITNSIETDGLLSVIPKADGSTNGYLSSTDWSTFNGKQAAGNYMTSLTGDVVAAGPGASAATIQAGVIVNSMVSASAAIAYSKLSLANSIVNADIAAAAAIDWSKMANLTTGRALVSDGNGDVSVATTTATEIGYVNGVTSAIQTQLDAKIAKADFTTKGQILVATGSGTYTALGVGSNDQVLTADSGQSSGVKWAAGASGGGFTLTTVNSNITAATAQTYMVDTSAARTITLPAAAANLYFYVKDKVGTANTNNITIARAASESIEGVAASKILQTNWGSWIFVCDGTNWFIL